MPEPTRPARPLTQASPPVSSQDLSLKPPITRVAARKTALGLVCTQSFPAVVNIADMMLKSSGVTLVGYEKTGDGYCTAVVRGNYADVKIAVQTGVDIAKQFEQYVSSMMLPRPLPNLDTVLPITETFAEYVERAGQFEARGAIGLIETTGFPAMVGASDAAMKCANVELITYETTGAGLCTAVLQGPIADVTMAIEAGMAEAERIGDLHAVAVIPRPLDDLMKVMPKPQHWVETPEEPQPLELPDPETATETAEERELQPLALPELERVPVEIQPPRAEAAEALELSQPELEPLSRELPRDLEREPSAPPASPRSSSADWSRQSPQTETPPKQARPIERANPNAQNKRGNLVRPETEAPPPTASNQKQISLSEHPQTPSLNPTETRSLPNREQLRLEPAETDELESDS